MQKRRINQIGIAAIGALMLSSPALAETYTHGGRSSVRVHIGSHNTSRTAGTLYIDGKAFCIDARRSISRQILEAFRCEGYAASYRRGAISVRSSRGCTPRVRWSCGTYDADICLTRSGLSISWCKIRTSSNWGWSTSPSWSFEWGNSSCRPRWDSRRGGRRGAHHGHHAGRGHDKDRGRRGGKDRGRGRGR